MAKTIGLIEKEVKKEEKKTFTEPKVIINEEKVKNEVVKENKK